MKNADREQLKDQLAGLVAGRGEGIDLDTTEHWVVEEISDPDHFFEALPSFFPFGGTLYFEGHEIDPEVSSFYERHRAANAVEVMRDMIFPPPEKYHVEYSAEFNSGLRALLQQRRLEKVFYHVKGYRAGALLFTFHDAFSGLLCISDRIPEKAIDSFCEALHVSKRKEETKPRDLGQLEILLKTLEGGKVPWAKAKPWWKFW